MAQVRNITDQIDRREQARAVERTFIDALERGDAASERLAARLIAAITGERPRPEPAR